MPNPRKFVKTIPVSVQRSSYEKVIKHIEKFYGNIGKFFSIAAEEKMIKDLKTLCADEGND